MVVADLGNSRLKWAEVGADGQIGPVGSAGVDQFDDAIRGFGDRGPWLISSVNPPAAGRLAAVLAGPARWFRSAADVPVSHSLSHPETAGADRAWAVLAAVAMHPPGRPGLVVSCGTALTLERIDANGVWRGGAIAVGLAMAARALHRLTAQLPEVDISEAPPAWGDSTAPAARAGVFWGTVGAIRELVARQSIGLDRPWLVWTGGDAPRLAAEVVGPGARVVPDLVLRGLARHGAGP